MRRRQGKQRRRYRWTSSAQWRKHVRENSLQRRQSSDNDAFGRQRSPSNASSGARSGLSGKIASCCRAMEASSHERASARARPVRSRPGRIGAVSRERDGGQADSTDDHAVTTASGGTSPAERFRRLSVGDDLGRKSLDTFDSGSMSSRLGVGSASARVLGPRLALLEGTLTLHQTAQVGCWACLTGNPGYGRCRLIGTSTIGEVRAPRLRWAMITNQKSTTITSVST